MGEAILGGRVWWVAPTYRVANEGWLLIRRLARSVPRARISLADRSVVTSTDGLLEVRSADNPDSLVGAGLDFVVLDEAADMQHEAWSESLRPALADRQGRAIFITTPRGTANWIYTDLWTRCDADPHWQRWQKPSWDNPYIAASEIEQMRNDMHPEKFSQEVGAEFVALSGRVFAEFSRERHVESVPFDPSLDVCLGWDFGYRITAIVVAQQDKRGGVRLIEDVELEHASTHDAAQWVLRRPWANRVVTIACDPAAHAHDVQTGMPDVRVLRSYFPGARVVYSLAPPDRNPESRASRIRDLLWSAAGTRRLVVDPKCKATIRALESSVYRDSALRDEPDKDGVLDHARDALGYLVVNLSRAPAMLTSKRPW